MLRDVGNHAERPQWLTRIGQLDFSVHLQPAHQTILAADPASDVEGTTHLHRLPKRLLERFDIAGMQVIVHELLSGQAAVRVCATKNFKHTVVHPERAIRLDVPFEYSKACSTRRDAQPRFTLPHGCLGAFALGDVEVHAKNTARPDVGIATEPALGTIGHAQAKLVLIGLMMHRHALLLYVTRI